MKVLVTGGAGYIGSHACKALARAGHTPVVFDNLRTGHRWAVKWGDFVHGDIMDPEGLDEALRTHAPDAVMHFAALAYVGESTRRPDLYFRTNIGGALTLLDAMRRNNINRLVFSSSCNVYGASDGHPLREDSVMSPINPYGRSKLIVEQMLADLCRHQMLGATALRYFNAAGADPDGELGEEHDPEPHLLPILLNIARGKLPHLEIYGDDYDTHDGTCIRDFVHVSDISSAHVQALESCEPGNFRAYNLGTGRGYSVRSVVAAVERVTGRPIPVRISPRRTGDAASLVADPDQAIEQLGWRANFQSIEPIIETAWNWMNRA